MSLESARERSDQPQASVELSLAQLPHGTRLLHIGPPKTGTSALQVHTAIVSDGMRFQFLVLSGTTLATSHTYTVAGRSSLSAADVGTPVSLEGIVKLLAWTVALGAAAART